MSKAEKAVLMAARVARAIERDNRYRAYSASKETPEYRAKIQAAIDGGLAAWQQFADEELAADKAAWAAIYGPDAEEWAATLAQRADLRSDLHQF